MKSRSLSSRRPSAAVPWNTTVTFEDLERRALLSGSTGTGDTLGNLAAFLGDWGVQIPASGGSDLSLQTLADDDDDVDAQKEAEKAEKEREKAEKEAEKAREKARKAAEKDKDDDDDDDDSGSGNGSQNDAAPSAQISVANLTTRSASAHTVTVVYADDKKIRARTIGTDDIVVSGLSGPNLTVTGVTISPGDDDDRIVATYSVAAPGGRWDTENGTYTVTVKPLQVFDSKLHPVASTSASFEVDLAVVDNAAPTAAVAVGNVSSTGGSSHKVTVTYTDDVGVNPQTIGPNDLTITGPGGARPVRSVSVNPNADGTVVTATYTFGAPGSAWGPEDNGTYQVTLNADQVRDASGKGATAGPATFTVNAPLPEPIDPGFGGGGGGTGGSGGGGTGGGGTGGAVTAPFVAEAVVAQPDGKIVVAGRQGNLADGSSRAVLQRFTPEGTLDATFGAGGRVITAAGANEAYYAISLDATGRVFVAGARGGDVLVSRYDGAGKLDAGYGKGGVAVTDLGTNADAANAIGVAPDGSAIVAAGPGGNFAMARYRADGTLDPNFASGGVQMFDLGSPDDTPGAVAFQDNKVVVVGTSGGKVAVVRLRTDGEADETFSGDGLLLLDALAARPGGAGTLTDRSAAAAVQPDGKLLLANRSAGGDFAVARLNANGSVDSSFGSSGVATVDFGGDDDADAIIVQETGEILVIGTTDAGGTANTAVAALSSSGSLISEFGSGGKLTLTPDVGTAGRELHVGDLVLRAFGTRQPDGRVVVGTTNGSQSGGGGGGTSAPQQQTTSLRRLNPPGVRSRPQGTLLGTFGTVDGRRSTLAVTDADGTRVTFSASRGSGTVHLAGGRFNLTISDGTGGAAVAIRTAGGDGRVDLGDVMVGGTLRSMTAKTGDVSGTFYASGSILKLALGELTGTLAAAGDIASASFARLTGARVMSGAGLGADGRPGGDNGDADTYGKGVIGTLRVAGPIEASTISAGLDPVDGTFNNDDDRVAGGAESVIRSVLARSADATSRFIAGKIVSLKLPATVPIATDERVRVLA